MTAAELTTSACPSCSEKLVTANAPPTRPLICSSCGTQFRVDGSWPERRRSKKAVTSLVLGVCSLVGLFVTGVPALILGALALGDIRRSPHSVTGKRLAWAGTILGAFFTFAIFLVPIAVAFFFAERINVNGGGRPLIRANEPLPDIPAEAVILVEPGASWTWFHPVDGFIPRGTDTEFQAVDFDDFAWQEPGEEIFPPVVFGYGDPIDVNIGRPPEGLRYSAYFRHRFETDQSFESLILTLYCDDGVVVYLDGNEVARENMPPGPVYFETEAINYMSNEDETAVFGIEINSEIPPGPHTLAISLHNSSETSSDLVIGEITLYGVPGQE